MAEMIWNGVVAVYDFIDLPFPFCGGGSLARIPYVQESVGAVNRLPARRVSASGKAHHGGFVVESVVDFRYYRAEIHKFQPYFYADSLHIFGKGRGGYS